MTAPRLTEAPLQVEPLLAETACEACGALVIFAGTVRDHHEGRQVTALTYEAHLTLAEAAILAIEARFASEAPPLRIRIAHRIGPLALGETAVLVVVRAPHRAEAFRAAEAALEAVKSEVPIWKFESYREAEGRWLDGTELRPKGDDDHA